MAAGRLHGTLVHEPPTMPALVQMASMLLRQDPKPLHGAARPTTLAAGEHQPGLVAVVV